MRMNVKEGEKAKKARTRGQLFYQQNKEERIKYARERRKNFPLAGLLSKISRKLRILRSGGICFICGEIYPPYLIEHHLLGRKNNNTPTHVDDLTISLCANCHNRFRASSTDAHTYFIGKAIEEGFMW